MMRKSTASEVYPSHSIVSTLALWRAMVFFLFLCIITSIERCSALVSPLYVHHIPPDEPSAVSICLHHNNSLYLGMKGGLIKELFLENSSKESFANSPHPIMDFLYDHRSFSSGFYVLTGEPGCILYRLDIPSREFTPVVGDGTCTTGADGIGVAASLAVPEGAAWHPNWNFILVTEPLQVVRISIPDYNVTRVLGSDTEGTKDDVGLKAQFMHAMKLAYRTVSEVFICDSSAHTIRRVTVPDFAIQTVAGTAGVSDWADGIGLQAKFDSPFDIVFGNPYTAFISDKGNKVIRRLSVPDMIVTTIAGVPRPISPSENDNFPLKASFYSPKGLCFAGTHLVVADATVRKFRMILSAVESPQLPTQSSSVPGKPQDNPGGWSREWYLGVYTALTLAAENTLDGIEMVNSTMYLSARYADLILQFDFSKRMFKSQFGLPFAATLLVHPHDPNKMFSVSCEQSFLKLWDLEAESGVRVAGSGTVKTEDGTGIAASFDKLLGLAGHPMHDFLVGSEPPGHVLRRIFLSNYSVLTIVGDPRKIGGEDGIGKNATLNDPCKMDFRNAQELFFCDREGTTVRQVFVQDEWKVVTVAGRYKEGGLNDGIGAQASFIRPIAIIFSSPYVSYISDQSTNTIRRMTYPDFSVVTIAGQASRRGTMDGPPLEATIAQPRTLHWYHGTIVLAEYDETDALRFIPVVPFGGATQEDQAPNKNTLSHSTSFSLNFSTTAKTQTTGSLSASLLSSHFLPSLSLTRQRSLSNMRGAQGTTELTQEADCCAATTRSLSEDPPSTPAPPFKHPQLQATAGVLGSETAANAAVGTGSSATVGAGLLSPSASMQSVRSFLVLGVLECNFAEDAELSYFEHPLQVEIPGGESRLLRLHAGSSLLTVIFFILLPWICSLIVQAVLQHHSKSEEKAPSTTGFTLANIQEKVITNFAVMSHGYFLPVLAKSFTLILAHTDALALLLTSSFALILCCVALPTFVATKVIFFYQSEVEEKDRNDEMPEQKKSVSTKQQSRRPLFLNRKKFSFYVETYGIYFTGCRTPSRFFHRGYYFIELVLSCVLGALAGIQPREGHCSVIAGIMLVTCLVHFLYYAAVRPLMSLIELSFALLISLTQLLLAALCVYSVAASTAPGEPVMEAIGYLSVLQNGMFFVEVFALAGWAYVRHSRRAILMASSSGESASSSLTQVLTVPEREEEDKEGAGEGSRGGGGRDGDTSMKAIVHSNPLLEHDRNRTEL